MEKTSLKTLLLFFSVEPSVLQRFFMEKEVCASDFFCLTTSFNNLQHSLSLSDLKILDPIDLLGYDATGNSFKETYSWQENISAQILERGKSVQEETTLPGSSMPGYLSWVMRFTPFVQSRRLLIETIDVALKEFEPDRIVLFGQGVTVPWHRALSVKALNTLAPKIPIVEFDELLKDDLKADYLTHIDLISKKVLDERKKIDDAAKERARHQKALQKIKLKAREDARLAAQEEAKVIADIRRLKRERKRVEARNKAQLKAQELTKERERARQVAISRARDVAEAKRLEREKKQEAAAKIAAEKLEARNKAIEETKHLREIEREKLVEARLVERKRKQEEALAAREVERERLVQAKRIEIKNRRDEAAAQIVAEKLEARNKAIEETKRLREIEREKLVEARLVERKRKQEEALAAREVERERLAEAKRIERKNNQEAAIAAREAKRNLILKEKLDARERHRGEVTSLSRAKAVSSNLIGANSVEDRIIQREVKKFDARLIFLQRYNDLDFIEAENSPLFNDINFSQETIDRIDSNETGKAFTEIEIKYSELRSIGAQKGYMNEHSKNLIVKCEDLLETWFPLTVPISLPPIHEIENEKDIKVRAGFIGARFNYEKSIRTKFKIPKGVRENSKLLTLTTSELAELEKKVARVVLFRAHRSIQKLF